MKNFGLGTAGEANKYKVFYIIYMFVLLAFVLWSSIGKATARMDIMFYVIFAISIGVIPVLFDNLTKKEFEEIDTVTIEKPSPIGVKMQFVIAIIISTVMASHIFITGTAWVPYPQFQLFDYELPNAMLSAAYGLMEQWVFFVFLFPTLFIILHKHVTKNYWLSFIVAAFIIAFVFTGYHIFRYAANDQALMSVFIFSWFNTIPMIIFKSTIVGDSLHATNNFVASIREVQRIGVSFGVVG